MTVKSHLRAFAPGIVMLLAVAAATRASTQSVPADNPLSAQPFDALSATRERPLFVATRRPPAPPPVKVVHRSEVPAPPPPAPNVVLLGIIDENDGESAQALVRLGAGKPLRLRVGDDVAGWKVARIEGRRLILTLAERSAEFTLFNGARPDRASSAAQAAVVSDRRAQARSGH
jgi:general secretion pathway protein N